MVSVGEEKRDEDETLKIFSSFDSLKGQKHAAIGMKVNVARPTGVIGRRVRKFFSLRRLNDIIKHVFVLHQLCVPDDRRS